MGIKKSEIYADFKMYKFTFVTYSYKKLEPKNLIW
jgi:hypothetical protein